MDQVQQWWIVVGFFTPLIVAAISRAEWPAWAKTAVAFGVSAVVAGVALWLQGQLAADNLVRSTLAIAVAAIAWYRSVWRDTGVTDALATRVNLLPAPPAGGSE